MEGPETWILFGCDMALKSHALPEKTKRENKAATCKIQCNSIKKHSSLIEPVSWHQSLKHGRKKKCIIKEPLDLQSHFISF